MNQQGIKCARFSKIRLSLSRVPAFSEGNFFIDKKFVLIYPIREGKAILPIFIVDKELNIYEGAK
jgi:hypothetical protein